MLPNWGELKKIASFGAIGVFNGFVDYGVFYALISLIFITKTSQDVVFANIGAWAVAVTSSYILNTHFTFKAETGGVLSWKKYLSFALAGLFGLAANTLSVLAFQIFLPLWQAKILAIGTTFVVNFAVTKYFVFKN